MDWWIVVLVISQWAFLCFLIWLAVSYRQKNLQRRSEERLRVLDRFGTAEELSEFLNAEQGRRFLELFAVRPKNPLSWLVAGIVVGIVLTFVGVAFLLLAHLDAMDLGVEYLVAAILILGAAFGTLVATLVSWRLARVYRLMPDRNRDDLLETE